MSKLRVLALSFIPFSMVYAQSEISIDSNISHPITTGQAKTIELIHYQFSARAKQRLAQKFQKNIHEQTLFQAPRNHLAAVRLGMANVPVLDQGSHGTCVTFAVTAAIDAALEKGDYISQLCSLTLGQYLENYGYGFSGWNGSSANLVLNQLENFGVINKTQEASYGCAGLYEYPDSGYTPKQAMSPEDYHLHSENLVQDIFPSVLMDPYQFIYQEISMPEVTAAVKKSLSQGQRVLIGCLLPLDEHLGAWGSYHQANDTWVLTDQMKKIDFIQDPDAINNFAGHEMIITGFDDSLEIKDAFGKIHQGAFILRNSWGEDAGDHGDYYMAYDFFQSFSWDLQRIIHLED